MVSAFLSKNLRGIRRFFAVWEMKIISLRELYFYGKLAKE